ETAINSVYAGLVEDQSKTLHNRDTPKNRRFLQSRISLREGKQGQNSMRDQRRTPPIILMAATRLVLLIAMATAANSLRARSAQRRKELAIRAALGASRSDIMGQLLTEALLLSAGGGLAGLAFASWTLSLLVARLAGGGEDPVRYLSTRLDWRGGVFCLSGSGLAGGVFGLGHCR